MGGEVELKENWEVMVIKDPPIEKKNNRSNQNDKKNKTEKQKKVKLKWNPIEKIMPGQPVPRFDGSLAELIPKSSNPDFQPSSSLYYSSQLIKHFTAPDVSATNFILNINQATAK